MDNNYLVCKGVKFGSMHDEDAFFEWIKKIKCIQSFEGARDELYLDLISDRLEDLELRDIIALFRRYKVDMAQLKRFLTEDNKRWFFDNKRAYWYKKVFGK
ncbi:hypothetical protein HYX58_03360 [Candidatus Dependentiae bacterium]|nr:hypothetical protein [Candidatus Dependentiae bacterium]